MEAVSVHLSSLPYLLQAIPFLLIVLNHTIMVLERFFPKHLKAYISLITYVPPTSWKHPCICTEKEFHHDTVMTKPETIVKQEVRISTEEIKSVMSDLGISLSKEDDQNQTKNHMSEEDFSTLFEETEPCLQEVKDAFLIFDQNGDGFIDAKELQTVLMSLGLREGTDLDACRSMIERHDRNRDGMIDQSEFYKLLESSLL